MTTVSLIARRWMLFILLLYLIMSWFREKQTRQDICHCLCSRSRNISSGELFQTVIFGTNDILVFSAFYFQSSITIVSILDMTSPERTYQCLFRGRELPASGRNTTATLQICPESHGTRFTAAIFSCKVQDGPIPDAVSLVVDDCGKFPVSNALPVISPSHTKRNFTVCTPPLHTLYSKAHQIVEMVEIGLNLGADHFFFYNLSTQGNVDLVLKHYESRGIATIIQWQLPAILREEITSANSKETNIHYYGQLAMVNDCLNRNRGTSKYVVFQDLDEVIVPKQQQSWPFLMASLPPNASAYMLRSSYFRLEWPNVKLGNSTANKIAKIYKANTFLKQYRENRIFDRAVRSKYIVDPLQVEIAGIHNVWKFKRGGSPYYVPPDVALVHHYRRGNVEAEIPRVKDNSVLRFTQALSHIHRTWRQLGVIGPLTENLANTF